MAGVACCLSGEAQEGLARSNSIDRILVKEKRNFKRTIKLLFLGSGESGKSTLLKQLRIIHGDKFSGEALEDFKQTIFQNVVKGMKVLIDARQKLAIAWENERRAEEARAIQCMSEGSGAMAEETFRPVGALVKLLWHDKSIRAAYGRRSEFQLADSVKYFFDNMDRLMSERYVPSKDDILQARKATKGITEYNVEIRGVPFKFVDIGGQRSQRQKWFQCFDCVTSILYLVACNEFDQVLLEDRKTNRLTESLNIFATIVQNKAFSNVSIILFLNKTDLLMEKVMVADIGEYFPGFPGDPRSLSDVQKFIYLLFKERFDCSPCQRQLFHHFTTAIDTENIKLVFEAVKETILQDNVRSLMMQ